MASVCRDADAVCPPVQSAGTDRGRSPRSAAGSGLATKDRTKPRAVAAIGGIAALLEGIGIPKSARKARPRRGSAGLGSGATDERRSANPKQPAPAGRSRTWAHRQGSLRRANAGCSSHNGNEAFHVDEYCSRNGPRRACRADSDLSLDSRPVAAVVDWPAASPVISTVDGEGSCDCCDASFEDAVEAVDAAHDAAKG